MTTNDTHQPPRVGTAIALAVVSAVAFSWAFSPAVLARPGFWWRLAAIVAGVNLAAWLADPRHADLVWKDVRRRPARKIVVGLLSAAALYAVFFAGDIASRAIFPFAGENIASVYSLRQDAGTWRIAALLILVIGPGEELFWRAYLQRSLATRFGRVEGLLLTTLLYGAVHAISGNTMLVVAAVVAGIFWGWLYARCQSPLLNAVSHTAWDVLVFLVLPFGG